MIIELKKNFRWNKTIENFWCSRKSMFISFLNALRTMNVTFVNERETILNYEIQQKKSSSFILNFLKKFRNSLRTIRTLMHKKTNHWTFAIFQNQSSNKSFANLKSDEKFEKFDKSNDSNFANFKKKKLCLCAVEH